MKCICRNKCFSKGPGGKSQIFSPGQVADFKKCPPHFDELDPTAPIDILAASEEEMLETKFSFAYAAEAVKEAYDVDLKKTDKADIVAQILDARNRALDNPDIEDAK